MTHKPMEKRLFTVKEAAAYLAVSRMTLYHWVYRRQVEFIKLSPKALRFEKCELDRIIDNARVKSGKEAAEDGLKAARAELLKPFYVAEVSVLRRNGSTGRD